LRDGCTEEGVGEDGGVLGGGEVLGGVHK